MKLRRIRVRAYRGIEQLDQEIPPAGALIQGSNAVGKSSVLHAISAALDARDVAADAIRIGHDRGEILVDLDDLTVRRAISQAGNTLTVTTPEGAKLNKPQERLRALLGTAATDPLDLYLAKPAERRNLILAAMPVTVTRDQLLQWLPDLPGDFSCEGHGLEVLERAHQLYYQRRADANKAVERAQEAVRTAKAAIRPWADPGVTAEQAQAQVEATTQAFLALRARKEQAEKSIEAAASARAYVGGLRGRADKLEAAAAECGADPTGPRAEAASLQAEVDAVRAQIAMLQHRERALQGDIDRLEGIAAVMDQHVAAAAKQREEAQALRAQADTQEQTIAAMAVAAPTDEEMEAAAQAAQAARAALLATAEAQAARQAEDNLAAAQVAAKQAEVLAEGLNRAVVALAKDAPAAVLAGADSIPGLAVRGDEVFLDGVALKSRSGAEQMAFAVQVAKRLNAKSRILVVDGLERLDPAQREEFVRQATADDWQLLGTVVTRGELVFGAIESDGAPAENIPAGNPAENNAVQEVLW